MCDQCQVLRINGVATHELGCPNNWRHPITNEPYDLECYDCGRTFKPDEKPRLQQLKPICPDCAADGADSAPPSVWCSACGYPICLEEYDLPITDDHGNLYCCDECLFDAQQEHALERGFIGAPS